jgi:hypothetical protein
MTAPYGYMAEFRTPEDVLAATRKARDRGYRRMDVYSPFPVEGVAEALGLERTSVPATVLAGGLIGAVGGYVLQGGLNAVDYPLNVGGRPLNSIPAWIPIMYELTILLGSLFAVLGMLALNGLPMPYHPVFNVPEFARASSDRFFLAIRALDPVAQRENPLEFFESLGAERTWTLEP